MRCKPLEEVGAGVVEDLELAMESVTILCARATTAGEEVVVMRMSRQCRAVAALGTFRHWLLAAHLL